MIKIAILVTLITITAATKEMLQEIKGHSAIWINIGNIFTTTSFAHLHIPIRTDDLRRRQSFMTSINERFQILNIPKDWPKSKKTNAQARLKDLKRFVYHTTEDTIERINEAIRSTHPKNETHRDKRQLISLAVGIAAGLVTGAIANEFSADTADKVVQDSQEVISKTVEENIIQIHDHDKDIRQLNITLVALINEFKEEFKETKRNQFETSILRVSFATLINSMELNKKSRAVRRATHGELDPESFSRRKLRGALEELNAIAVSKGFEAISQDTDDLAKFPSTYLIDSRTETIHLITHIPLYHPGEKMKLHKYLNIPMAFNTSHPNESPIHLEISPPTKLLAISHDGTTYIELQEDEMDTCKIQDGNYFCPILGKFKKQRRSCITALYNNQADDIKNNCPVMVVRPESKMERLNKETWILVEPEETQIIISCHEEEHRSKIKGSYILNLPEGCAANTDSMTLMAPRYEAEVVMDGTVIESQTSPYQWIEEGEEPHIKETAMELLRRVGQKAKLDDITALTRFKSKMRALHAPSWKLSLPNFIKHGIFPSISTIFIIAVLWCAGLYIIPSVLKKYRQNQSKQNMRRHPRYVANTESVSLDEPMDWS